MYRIGLVAFGLTALGCTALKEVSGQASTERKWLVAAAGIQFKCARENVLAVEDREFFRFGPGYPWSVTACGQSAICRLRDHAPVMSIESWECRTKPGLIETARIEPDEEGFAQSVTGVESIAGRCPQSPDVWLVKPRERRGKMVLGVRQCGREFGCSIAVDSVNELEGKAACTETPDSYERTSKAIVVDRLALETGCPRTNIEIISAAEWRRSTERGFRLAACGNVYVCTTASGRTDCKPALDQPASALGAGPDRATELGDAGP